MSVSPSPGTPLQSELELPPKGGFSPKLRPAILLILLAAEALVLGLRFDGESLATSGSPAIRALAQVLGSASAFAVTLVAASLLLGSSRWSEELAALRAAGRPSLFGFRVAAQLASFSLLCLASVGVFDSGPPVGGWEIAAWMSALLATVGCWLALWAPWSTLRLVAWRLAGVAVSSLALGGLAYASGRFAQQLWAPLRAWTFALVAPMARALVPTAEVDPQSCVVATDELAVEISAPCSGYEGLGLTLVFLGAFFWVFRDRLRLRRTLLLVAPILAVVWLLNVVRIVVLVAVGAYVSPALALGSFHSYVGTLLFAGANLAIMFGLLRWPLMLRPEALLVRKGRADHERENLAASYLVPFLCLVAAALVSAMVSTDGARFYPARVLVAAGALWFYRAPLRRFLRPDPRTPGAAATSTRVLPWAVAVGLLTAGAWLLSAAAGAGPDPAKSDGLTAGLAETTTGRLLAVAWWWFRIVGTVWIVPLAEELAFRGFVIRRLASPDVDRVGWADITPFALVGQAILFGVLHPQHMLGGCLAGLAYGWIGRRTRCGYAPVMAHAVTNAFVFVLAAATGRWDWL